MKKRMTRPQWQDFISSWEISKQNQAEFCKTNSLKLSTFQYWRSRLQRENLKPEGFIEVIPNKDISPLMEIRIDSDGAIRLKFNLDFRFSL
jgi:hypothetical protein